MRLYERFADKGFHTSVTTTFGIDFDAYESIALSRLRGAGCRNNLVIADSRMLTHALSGASDLPQRAGTHYTVSGANAAGVFHPKLFLQFGRRSGRMIIGSANLTPSGLAGNLELVGTIACDEADTGEQRLVAQAWDYASGFIDDERQSVTDQHAWMQRRTAWLPSAVRAEGPVDLADGTRAALLLSGGPSGIAQRFTALIDDPVQRLIVISPYWDPDLAALSYLAERLNPNAIAVLVDPQTREFPKDAVDRIDGLTLYSRGSFREGRFIHAKAVIAQTASADHILLGSANCTSAALGGANFAGTNAEACLYRCLPAGSVIEALGLGELLVDDQIISPHELNEPEYGDDLPLAELGRLHPGQFEGRADSLLWHTGTVNSPNACRITLLGSTGQPVSGTLRPLPGQSERTMRFQLIDLQERPVFARVTFADGHESAPAIITWIDTLKMEIRETRRSGLQNRLEDLESDTEASLALLEILNELETLERGQDTPKEPLSIPKTRKDDSGEPDSSRHRTLSYEEFVAGRRPRTSGHEFSYNSLAGSDVSIVRGILNRIIGLGDVRIDQEEAESDQHKDAFDLGDETEDAEGALAAGGEFGKHMPSSETTESDEEKHRRRAKLRRATQDQLVKAVQQFQERIKEQQTNGEALTNYDLMRLRALLMILCTAASPHASHSKTAGGKFSRLRVLPVEGDQNSWPMVIGRLLFTFFGGKRPAIRLLHLTDEHDQIPGDFNECWATCYWAFQACIHAPLSRAEQTRIEKQIKPIARTAFLLTLPSKDELLAEEIVSVMDRMSESYAEELNIDAVAIRNGHRTLVEETFEHSLS